LQSCTRMSKYGVSSSESAIATYRTVVAVYSAVKVFF